MSVGVGPAQENAVFHRRPCRAQAVPARGLCGRLCRRGLAHLFLGLALLLLEIALEHLEVLAVAALLGHPDLAPVLEVRRLLRRRRSHPDRRRAYPLAHYSRSGVALDGL